MTQLPGKIIRSPTVRIPGPISLVKDAENNFADALKTALAQQKAVSTFDLGSPCGLVDFDDFVLDWTPTGNTISKLMDLTYDYSGWRELEDTVFASSSGKALFNNPSRILADGNVIGRLTIADPDTVPAGRNELYKSTYLPAPTI